MRIPVRFISLFSGIGGMDLGLEAAGHTCVAQVEVDSFCREVLSVHWPNVPKYKDVRDVSGRTLPAADCIVGGFPCQPVSEAGQKQADSDSRWLWPEFARLVDEVRPTYVIVENVSGLLYRGGTDVIADLATLGYDARWDRVFAAATGAPHLRERVFIVAHAGGARLSGPLKGDWELESQLGGSIDGLPNWVDGDWERGLARLALVAPDRIKRLRALGNAVVPQVAYHIGRSFLIERQPDCTGMQLWPTPKATKSGPDFASSNRKSGGMSLPTAVARSVA